MLRPEGIIELGTSEIELTDGEEAVMSSEGWIEEVSVFIVSGDEAVFTGGGREGYGIEGIVSGSVVEGVNEVVVDGD